MRDRGEPPDPVRDLRWPQRHRDGHPVGQLRRRADRGQGSDDLVAQQAGPRLLDPGHVQPDRRQGSIQVGTEIRSA